MSENDFLLPRDGRLTNFSFIGELESPITITILSGGSVVGISIIGGKS